MSLSDILPHLCVLLLFFVLRMDATLTSHFHSDSSGVSGALLMPEVAGVALSSGAFTDLILAID